MKPRKRKCRECGEWYIPFNSLQKACSVKCAVAIGRHEQIKADKKEHQRRKTSVRPLTAICSDTQSVVNQYIRLRDQRKGCISCGSPFVTDAGHFVHAGSKYRTSRLRFDERNLNGQCGHCNRYAGGGNKEAYAEGYRQRYGDDALEELYELQRKADRGELEPLTKDEAREIAREYRRKVREMKKERE